MNDLITQDEITPSKFLLDVMNVPTVNNDMTVYSAYFCPGNETKVILIPV